ncbi:hypothetical protein MY3957_006075 [Beauveria namnaoensis]
MALATLSSGFDNNGKVVERYNLATDSFVIRIEFYPTDQDLPGSRFDTMPAIRMCQHQMWMPAYICRLSNLRDLSILSAEEETEFKQLSRAIYNDLHKAVLFWQPKVNEPKLGFVPALRNRY